VFPGRPDQYPAISKLGHNAWSEFVPLICGETSRSAASSARQRDRCR